MNTNVPFLAWILILPLFVGAGCTSASVQLDTAHHSAVLEGDRQTLQAPENLPKNIDLTLDDAMDIAMRQNLDARVSALELVSAQDNITLEAIRALPSVEYTLARNGRNNESASTSFSVLTGEQSLEPSISTERYRDTYDLNLNWNVIDAATAILQTRTATDRAQISEERYRKVQQNIYRDVRSAYWRAWAGDQVISDTRALNAKAKTAISNIDQAAAQKLITLTDAQRRKTPYIQSLTALQNLQNEAALANVELKSLLNLPQAVTLNLVSVPPKSRQAYQDLLSADIEALEMLALKNRPEMRESFIEKNISIRATKEEIIQTIPGTQLFYGLSRDSNQFLENNDWRTYSISLVQNITNLLTLPKRYSIARKNEDLSEARRVTLAAAILAQLHIARHGLHHAQELEALAVREKEAAQAQAFAARKRQNAGALAKGEALLTHMQAQEKRYAALQALAQTQDSYAALLNSLGLGIEDQGRINLATLKAQKSFAEGRAS